MNYQQVWQRELLSDNDSFLAAGSGRDLDEALDGATSETINRWGETVSWATICDSTADIVAADGLYSVAQAVAAAREWLKGGEEGVRAWPTSSRSRARRETVRITDATMPLARRPEGVVTCDDELAAWLAAHMQLAEHETIDQIDVRTWRERHKTHVTRRSGPTKRSWIVIRNTHPYATVLAETDSAKDARAIAAAAALTSDDTIDIVVKVTREQGPHVSVQRQRTALNARLVVKIDQADKLGKHDGWVFAGRRRLEEPETD